MGLSMCFCCAVVMCFFMQEAMFISSCFQAVCEFASCRKNMSGEIFQFLLSGAGLFSLTYNLFITRKAIRFLPSPVSCARLFKT